jgi:hypothetical protein
MTTPSSTTDRSIWVRAFAILSSTLGIGGIVAAAILP